MNKPTKKEFGWETWCGWANGNLNEYLKELKRWENRPRKANAGRKRTREIDPSWLPFLDKFQPVPGKSQGAFCRWADLNRATFSGMQTKPIPMHIVELIGMWEAKRFSDALKKINNEQPKQ